MNFKLNEGPDYLQIENTRQEINLNAVVDLYKAFKCNVDNIEVRNFIKKVHLFCDKNNCDFNEVLNEIPNNKYLQLHLMKNASKQNIYETTAYNCLKELQIFDSILNLPNGGNKALSLSKNGIIHGVLSNDDVKTVDFYGIKNNITFVFSHKYTCGSGGSQDNQFLDARKFLERGVKCANNKLCVIAILDGKYYQNAYKRGNKTYENKIEFLNNVCHTKNKYTYATDIYHIKDIIEHYINNNLFL